MQTERDFHTVVWKVMDDYDSEGQGEDCACDWDDPYDVFLVQAGQYGTKKWCSMMNPQ